MLQPPLALLMESAQSQPSSTWIGTFDFAEHMGIHPQTIRKLKNAEASPWRKGVHYRTKGITGKGPVQWNWALAEGAFRASQTATKDQPDSQEMTQSEIVRMFQIAQVHGGGFIRKLATAGLVADPDNVGKILRTWPELQGMYGPGSIHWNREDV